MIVLIIDDLGTPSLTKRSSYTDAINPGENVKLIVITSTGCLTSEDKSRCLDWAEVDHPSSNGKLELVAVRMHEKHGFDVIYTRQEDLILRASYLREMLGIKVGLLPDEARMFRDKFRMKEVLQEKGIGVPAFKRVFSPVDVIAFSRAHGYPVVIKPRFGSASANVKVLNTEEERDAYIEKEFYDLIDDYGKCMDYNGDIVIEAFQRGTMYHVNGYARSGALEIVWPFVYISTNLGFTSGKSYGNVLIPRSDDRYAKLIETTQKVLDGLPCREHLVFHLELFWCEDGVLRLCEIAARRPGGSIGPLIQLAENGQNFPESEFRLSIGLPLKYDRKESGGVVADLMVPLRIGTLVKMPAAEDCPVDGVTFIPIGKVGTVYKGFSITVMNTCARFVVAPRDGEQATVQEVTERLRKAQEWFDAAVLYE
ncbi:hypothetical protein HK101_002944 [Irineochytrium annulatum]|nr:hypothetical protein HK101_002944 [Irineochytrium annulatum]